MFEPEEKLGLELVEASCHSATRCCSGSSSVLMVSVGCEWYRAYCSSCEICSPDGDAEGDGTRARSPCARENRPPHGRRRSRPAQTALSLAAVAGRHGSSGSLACCSCLYTSNSSGAAQVVLRLRVYSLRSEFHRQEGICTDGKLKYLDIKRMEYILL